MERMLTPEDVAQVLSVSRRTAYDYMTQMPHLDRPRRVSEYSLHEWIMERTIDPTARKRMHNVTDYRLPRRRA